MNIRNIYMYIFLLEKRIPTISRWFEEITRLFTCFKRHVIIDTIVPPIFCNRSKSHYGITYLCGNFEKSVPFIHWQFLESTNTRWNAIERRKRPRRPRGTHSIHRTNPIASHIHAQIPFYTYASSLQEMKFSLCWRSVSVFEIKIFLQKEEKNKKGKKDQYLRKNKTLWKREKNLEERRERKKKWQTKEQEKEKENEIRGSKEEETKQERDTFGAVLHSFSRWWKRRANLATRIKAKEKAHNVAALPNYCD